MANREVFLVTTGTYSDYSVAGVYSTLELAEAAITARKDARNASVLADGSIQLDPEPDPDDAGRIEVYEVDVPVECFSLWEARIGTSDEGRAFGDVTALEEPIPGGESRIVDAQWEPGPDKWVALGFGPTREHAVRSAMELWRARRAIDVAKMDATLKHLDEGLREGNDTHETP